MKSYFKRLGEMGLSLTHQTILVWLGLTVVVFLFYYPILFGYFITDDYYYMVHLLDAAPQYIQGNELKAWFFDYYGTTFLRPLVQWLWLTDFIAWYKNAAGYYLTNIILYVLHISLIYALSRKITLSRLGAITSALCFTLHPVHVDSVAWISGRTDLLCALFVLLSAFYYMLFRQDGKLSHLLISVIALGAAMLTKENAILLPFVLIVYDVLFIFSRIRWRMLKVQLVLLAGFLGYFVLRFALFHGLGGYGNVGFMSFGWELFVQYYTLALAKPFLTDLDRSGLFVVLALTATLIFIYRDRKGLWLGSAWVILMLLPAGSAGGVAPRLAYIPSIGLAIAQGAIWTSLFPHRNTIRTQQVSVGLLAILAMIYGIGLNKRVDDWVTLGQVTASIQREMQRLYPSFPSSSHVYIKSIPQFVRGLDPYAGNFPFAIKTIYHNSPYFHLWYGDEFPVVSDKLEQSYFLEYRRRTIVERPDVQQILLKRRDCLGFSIVQAEWDFSKGAQGWEVWNQLTDFEVHEGVLVTRSLGNDPYIASPTINVPTLAIGDIEIEMRVSADTLDAQNGQVYWLVAGASDFSPDFKVTFPVRPDGEFHTYRVNLATTGLLPIGNRITRLRLDPIESPAEIALRTIRIFSHCTDLSANLCQCQ